MDGVDLIFKGGCNRNIGGGFERPARSRRARGPGNDDHHCRTCGCAYGCPA